MTKTMLGAAMVATLLLSAGAHARGPTMNLTEQERYDAANPARPLASGGSRVDCSDSLNQKQGGVDLKNATCATGSGSGSGRRLVPTQDWNGGLHPKTH